MVGPKKALNRNQAIEALWYRGVLHWKLDDNQKVMHKMCAENPNKILVLGASRRLGKTYFLVCYAIEYCLQHPNSIVKFIAPTTKDIRRIIAPLVREITKDCPKDIVPSYKTQENIWRFSNGSEIQLAGTNAGHAESIRGNEAHLCIIDEAGFCDELAYIVNSILIPTTSMTNGKIIMASTPPKSLDHDFIRFMRQAQLNDAYIKRTIYDNPRLSKEQIDHIAESTGGVGSVDFRREYLVELITSDEDAIIPEFSPIVKSKMVREVTAPPFYDSYVGMDLGVRDLTVVLFANYDFKTSTVHILDEIVMGGKELTTDALAANIKIKEAQLWTNKQTGVFKAPMLRVSDNNNLLLLNDLQINHDILFLPVKKDGVDAALNQVRMIIKQNRLVIHPKCTTLIDHLETGIWNKARTSFARSSDKGHFDAIHSLIYLLKSIDFLRNPYPSDYVGKAENFHFAESFQEPTTSKFESSLKGLIRRRSITRYRPY
jgi:hypothetical protein